MTGVLVSRDGTQKVTIRDISKNGAHVAARDRIGEGRDVLLSRGPLFAAAQVVWTNGTEAGLKFYRELSPDEIDGTLPDAVLTEAC
jgi:hypothetical protein